MSKQNIPIIKAFFDIHTNTVSYVVSDSETGHSAIIDSVMDYDPARGSITSTSADRIVQYVKENDYTVDWILETHAHADHLSAAPYLQDTLGGKIAIGEHIQTVQDFFKRIFSFQDTPTYTTKTFDHLFTDGEVFSIGTLEARVLHTPGHTPADVTYLVGNAAFVGDTLFMPDYGSARCDFPGGNAETLYQSVQKIYALPEDTRLYMCHDYLPEKRQTYLWETTVAEEKMHNIHLNSSIPLHEFVALREARDADLGMPTLIIPSLQVNIQAGKLPAPEKNGIRYFKIPLNSIFSK
jgi:glyoxylase-like metal-dependent hydrolase (beta-lactamase superfamily II)